ncbi:hypothetical protein LRB11_17290, partial [Ectothiorhodospira haloalkaliphila]
QTWAEKERQKGRQEGEEIGLQRGRQENARETAINLLALGLLDDHQIAQTTGLSLDEVKALRSDQPH